MNQDPVEERVHDFIRRYIVENGHPPTLREMSAGLYLGTSSVIRCLDILEARGRIARKPGKSRGIMLLDDPS